MLIEAKGVVIRFADKTAVDGADLSIDAMERIAIVGESGSGKSTLARTLLGLLPEATVAFEKLVIDGHDMQGAKQSDWRKLRGSKIALMLQDPRYSLHPTMTIADQIGEVAKRPVADCLAEVGLDAAIAHRFPHQLSGGQGQRAYLAMALAQGPKLLIADEPTSALDPDLARQMMDLILEKASACGMALLLITHDIELAIKSCSRLLVMREGRVVETLESGQSPAHPFTRRLIEAIPRMPRC